MIYWIEDSKTGAKLGVAGTREKAEELSQEIFNKGFDNYIREEK